MTPSLIEEQKQQGSSRLIEDLIAYATMYAASHSEPRDGSCWETIGRAHASLRRSDSGTGELADLTRGDSLWLGLEHELLSGLQRGHFFLNYQPVIDIDTDAVVGVEALARWIHPRLGAIPPTAFIPAAEQTGCIHALGRHILIKGCEQFVTWEQQGLRIPYLSVNVSPLQFTREKFVARRCYELSARPGTLAG